MQLLACAMMLVSLQRRNLVVRVGHSATGRKELEAYS